MSEFDPTPWIERARRQIEAGQLDGAIESLRQGLGLDPRHPEAHALLALCLLDKRRLHAARHEAARALELAPEAPLVHYITARVRIAERKFREAEEHIEELMRLEPDDSANYRLLADLYHLTRRERLVLETLEKARDLDPGSPETAVDLGRYHLSKGALDAAQMEALRALREVPDQREALVLLGEIHLRRGKEQEARDHALWVLGEDATHGGALHLLAGVKARQNAFLGLWWRFNSWLSTLGEGKSILVLLAMFAAQQLAQIVARDLGRPEIASTVGILWLVVVAYTWIGPAIFQASLAKELAGVRLKRDF